MSLKTPKSAEWRFLRGLVVRPGRCQAPHPRRRKSDAHPTD